MKFKSAIIPLLVLNILIFILQIALGRNFTEALILTPNIFTKPWILLTYMFLHGSLSHLFFNMYALILFGPLLEHKIGAKRFLTIYLLSGIIAAFVSSFFYPAALGASGAIMGMIGVTIILLPNLRLLFLFFIPMPLWIAGITWALIDLFGVFGYGLAGVGNIAHLVGMACGLSYGLYLKKERKKFNKRFYSKTYMDKDDIEEYFRTGRI